MSEKTTLYFAVPEPDIARVLRAGYAPEAGAELILHTDVWSAVGDDAPEAPMIMGVLALDLIEDEGRDVVDATTVRLHRKRIVPIDHLQEVCGACVKPFAHRDRIVVWEGRRVHLVCPGVDWTVLTVNPYHAHIFWNEVVPGGYYGWDKDIPWEEVVLQGQAYGYAVSQVTEDDHTFLYVDAQLCR